MYSLNFGLMSIRTVLGVVLIGIVSSGCGRQEEIVLGKVTDLPEYFSETFHFGKDLRSISELNEFTLVTGKIDTTTETPPRRLAVISVGHSKIFIGLKKSTIRNDEINEQYAGSGYSLDLTYKEQRVRGHSPIYEGYFTVEHGNLRSTYNVVGTSGYY